MASLSERLTATDVVIVHATGLAASDFDTHTPAGDPSVALSDELSLVAPGEQAEAYMDAGGHIIGSGRPGGR